LVATSLKEAHWVSLKNCTQIPSHSSGDFLWGGLWVCLSPPHHHGSGVTLWPILLAGIHSILLSHCDSFFLKMFALIMC
jgi:hypothetical protein